MPKVNYESGNYRDIKTECGFTTSGSLIHVNARFRLHKKVCDKCKVLKLPEYNVDNAVYNGYNELIGNKNRIAVKNDLNGTDTFIDEI